MATRRRIIAVAVLLGGAMASLGIAAVSSDDLWIPAPTPGTTWHYEVHDENGGKFLEPWAWSPVEAARLQDGSFSAVRFLEQGHPSEATTGPIEGQVQATMRYGYDADGALVVGQYNWAGFASKPGVLGRDPGRTEVDGDGLIHIWQRADSFCPLPHFQAQVRLDPERAVDLCGTGQWQPFGTRVIDGTTAYGFQWELKDIAWFIPGLPVPILWEGAEEQRRLHDFSWGGGAWDWNLTLPDTHWDTLELAPRQPWGPDETGIDHPFPLSLAYTLTTQDPTFEALQDYLREHPRAVAVTGLVFPFEGSAGTDWLSAFQLTDGQRMFSWIAMHRVIDHVTDATGGAVGRAADLHVPLLYAGLKSDHPRDLVHPDQLPGRMPPVAALLERHADAQDPTATPVWGFTADRSRSGEGHWWAIAGDGQVDQDFVEYLGTALGAPLGPVFTEARSIVANEHGEMVAIADAQQRLTTHLAAPDESQAVAAEPDATIDRLPLAIGAFAAIVALAVAFLPKLKAAGLALFSRLLPTQVVEHPSRRAILEAIAAEPGLHQQELSRRTGLQGGVMDHHLHHLQQAGAIKVHRAAGYVCLFPASASRQVVAAAPALRAPAARRLVETIRSHPGISQKDAADAVGVAPGTLAHHVRRLKDAGVIDARRDGRVVGLWPATV